jgi:hypothetical protein
MVLEIPHQNAVKAGNTQTMTIHMGRVLGLRVTSRHQIVAVLVICDPRRAIALPGEGNYSRWGDWESAVADY